MPRENNRRRRWLHWLARWLVVPAASIALVIVVIVAVLTGRECNTGQVFVTNLAPEPRAIRIEIVQEHDSPVHFPVWQGVLASGASASARFYDGGASYSELKVSAAPPAEPSAWLSGSSGVSTYGHRSRAAVGNGEISIREVNGIGSAADLFSAARDVLSCFRGERARRAQRAATRETRENAVDRE